jgi:hypothetical protein
MKDFPIIFFQRKKKKNDEELCGWRPFHHFHGPCQVSRTGESMNPTAQLFHSF